MSVRPRPRRLTGEEARLWSQVAAQIRPLRRGDGPPGKHAATQTVTDTDAMAAGSALDRANGDPGPARRPVSPPADTPRPKHLAPRLDARLSARLARGKLTPEARLDLHGMTLAEARPALAGFLARAEARGQRLVLVITGKGSVSAAPEAAFQSGRGILRRQVPEWLRQGAFASGVVEVREAHRRHGGAGALYVWLRRPRERSLQRARPEG